VSKNTKVLYISSSEIYSGAKPPYKETDIGTTTPQHPRACYIEGKRCGEAICMAYKEQGYDVKIARLALAYGPGTKKGDTRVINQFIEQALTTGEIKMKDGGTARRTYCYVEDVAQMMLDVLFKGRDCVYNVGGDTKVTIYSLAHSIGLLTKSKVISGEGGLDGAPDDVCLDMTKTLNEFPRKFVGLLEGLSKTVEYQKQLYV
jgi:nucleoside-diphosphate-sugar epimerase